MPGPWRGRLHTTGMHCARVISLQTRGGGAMAIPRRWAFVALSVTGLGLRVLAWQKRREPSLLAGALLQGSGAIS
ncbi:MAG: hypothetical protein FJ194_12665 [Gammaproteobacteria bacterium]|nr:hypothetical protein [Gammaproteobacteria bacterium]